MPTKREKKARVERTCAFCELATEIPLSDPNRVPDMICEKHGIVRADHSCRHFRYDLLKREPTVKT